MTNQNAISKVRKTTLIYAGAGVIIAGIFCAIILQNDFVEFLISVTPGTLLGLIMMAATIWVLAVPFAKLLQRQSMNGLWIGIAMTVVSMGFAILCGGSLHGLISSGQFGGDIETSLAFAFIACYIIGGFPAFALSMILGIHLYVAFRKKAMDPTILDHGI